MLTTPLLLLVGHIWMGSAVRTGAPGTRYLSESWAMLSGPGRAANRPRCVPIPRNLSLCYGIDYADMRLPNLLEHEQMDEVVQQSSSWLPLIRLNCHPDTRLFLCSLFAPVCVSVDKPIPPCHSLCAAVQRGCETRMRSYGFPWPAMLSCDQFPTTTDMCIQPRTQYVMNNSCEVCTQVDTYENLLDHFCRSQFVLKVKLSRMSPQHVRMRAARSLKLRPEQIRHLHRRNSGTGPASRSHRGLHPPDEAVRGQLVYLSSDHRDCDCGFHDLAKKQDNKRNKRQRYLLMADRDERTGQLIANILMPWQKTKPFKRAVRTFRRIDCGSLGRVIRDRARRRQPPAAAVYTGSYSTAAEPFY